MIATSATRPGKATTQKKLFSRETTVSINIQADPTIVWALLTNADDFTRWNSTVTSLNGTIAPGGQIKLKSKLDPKREFRLTIKVFEPGKRLVWGDAIGQRIYTIAAIGNNLTCFTMSEKISGPLFPLFAKLIPPFDESFDQFARDLKAEAETIANSK